MKRKQRSSYSLKFVRNDLHIRKLGYRVHISLFSGQFIHPKESKLKSGNSGYVI